MSAMDGIEEGLEERGFGLASWVGRGVIKEVRFNDGEKQILLEVCPIPENDPDDDSADFCSTMRLLSIAVQSNAVVWVPPAIGDHCVYIAENGDPAEGGFVIGYQNNDEDPIPTGFDLAKFLVRLPDGVDGEVRRDGVRIIFEGGKITMEADEIEIGLSASKGAAREDDQVDCGVLTYTSFVPPATAGTLVWVPPAGVATSGPNTISLRGKIDQSSSKTKIE